MILLLLLGSKFYTLIQTEWNLIYHISVFFLYLNLRSNNKDEILESLSTHLFKMCSSHLRQRVHITVLIAVVTGVD